MNNKNELIGIKNNLKQIKFANAVKKAILTGTLGLYLAASAHVDADAATCEDALVCIKGDIDENGNLIVDEIAGVSENEVAKEDNKESTEEKYDTILQFACTIIVFGGITIIDKEFTR